MIEVRQIRCVWFAANIYVIENQISDSVWLVDAGDGEVVLPDDKTIKGIFITHSHVDHIMGLNALIERFPDVIIYTSEEGSHGLFNSKRNLSFYHELPFTLKNGKVEILHEGDEIKLYDGIKMRVFETPGHNPGCLSFLADKFLFTGDSLVSGYPVVTKLKGGNRKQAEESLKRLQQITGNDTIVCGGHEDMVLGLEKIEHWLMKLAKNIVEY